MEKLTKEQINSVVAWMNTWEQLKNTAIPIRFKEDFRYSDKPPLGLVPRKIRENERLVEVKDAIIRYMDASKPIPQEWIDELNELMNYLG